MPATFPGICTMDGLEAAENAGNVLAHVGAWAFEALPEVHP
jgi:hypothetical protein